MNGAGLIKKAKSYLGKNWKKFCNAYGYKYAVPWCCIWEWYVFKACGLSELFFGGLKVCNCRVAWNWCKKHLKHVKMADAKAGDIVFFTWTGKGNNKGSGAHSIDHIGFIRKKGTSSVCYTIEGNTNGSTPATSKVANRTRAKAYIVGIYRPKYPAKTPEKVPANSTVNSTTKTTLKGYDISYWQGKITKANFEKSLKAGWKFAILRIGYNRELKKDSVFENNYKNALAAGLKVGVYYYSTALNAEQAKAEANFVLKELKGRKLMYPVFIDFEDPTQSKLGKDKSKKICEAFCAVIEKAGYPAGVYASYNFLTNKIGEINKKYYVWLAQYPTATYKGRYELHQYSSSTPIPGVASKTDADTSTLSGGVYPKK